VSKHGWNALSVAADSASTPNLRFAGLCNCPPFGYLVEGVRGMPCQRARICPYCYARRVTAVFYRAVRFALFAEGKTCIRPSLQFVAFTRVQERAVTADKPVAHWIARTKAAVHNDLKLVPAKVHGSAILTTLEPAKIPGQIKIRRSTLMAVRDGVDLSALKERGVVRVLAAGEVKVTKLAKLIALATVYPLGMMTRDAAMAAEIYNATAAGNVRMFSTRGIFRNVSSQGYERKPQQQETAEYDD
jgi:hypothetical protein